MWKSIAAIVVGAAAGALLRWWIGAKLNSLYPTLPPGTLAVNLAGAFIIGAAIAFFAAYGAVAPQWRLLIVTGFCGSLTTFSTFSAEIVALLRDGRLGWACGEAAVHLGGSVLMTVAGIAATDWLLGLTSRGGA